MKKIFYVLAFFFTVQLNAQKADTSNTSKLMQEEGLQIEATEALNNMYNFKFDVAEAKFQEILLRYPEHPLPYYLIGLSNWWKMMPFDNEDDPRLKQYEPAFDKYMELSIKKAEKIYDKNENDIEATFFLCAAHGLIARHYAENGQEMRSINNTRKAFSYFKQLNDNNNLSPEFMFGSALFNYYAAWFKQEYPILSPVLALFPKGDKALGIKQLKNVSYNSFWTRTEAQYFLMRIYFNEEDDDRSALPFSEYLARTFPDNPYFQRIYARIVFTLGNWKECKEVSESILYKINIGMPGYEETSGRYAAFFLGRIYKSGGNFEKAKEYYKKAMAFAEKTDATKQNYYLHAAADLARMSDKEKDVASARQYYETIVDKTDHKNELHKEAKEYLKKTEEKKKGWFW
jgi:tetratricopeptide (TPR) repeat protein